MSDGFTAKEVLAMHDVSIDQLKSVVKRWYKYGTSKNTIIIAIVIGIILLAYGQYEGNQLLTTIGILSMGWARGKQRELSGYVEGYSDGYSEGSENTQKQMGLDVDGARDMFYGSN